MHFKIVAVITLKFLSVSQKNGSVAVLVILKFCGNYRICNCVNVEQTESQGKVSSRKGRINSPFECCVQEDWQKVGAESSALLRSSAAVAKGNTSFLNC